MVENVIIVSAKPKHYIFRGHQKLHQNSENNFMLSIKKIRCSFKFTD